MELVPVTHAVDFPAGPPALRAELAHGVAVPEIGMALRISIADDQLAGGGILATGRNPTAAIDIKG